jgi:sugar phosphate isomerase/epimerase
VPSRIAFSTLAFPDATLAAAISAGRRWGYSGVELRLVDGELIDPAMPAERRAQVRRTLAASASSAVAELLALLSADGAPSDLVGAVWDSHHPHRMGETPAEVYANLGSRLLLAQVKDARRAPDGDWRLVLLGAGEVPVREMLGLLTAGGYPHWISVEWEKRWHPEIEDPEVALPQHLDLLTAWLESDL